MAVAVAVAAQALGSLLVLALLVAPAVAVRRRSAGPGSAIAAGGGVAVVAGVVGIYGSHHLGTAAGASVALALCGAAAVGAGLPPRLRRPGAHAAQSDPV